MLIEKLNKSKRTTNKNTLVSALETCKNMKRTNLFNIIQNYIANTEFAA